MAQGALRKRRIGALGIIVIMITLAISFSQDMWQAQITAPAASANLSGVAADLLTTIAIKGRAPKTGYARTQFGDGWATTKGCDTRNIILHRDLRQPVVGEDCKVTAGTLNDPYTAKMIIFNRAIDSSAIQIDHVVALGNAWQTGAQQLTKQQRQQLANDPLELLAVDGPANQQKSDGDAATWLPANKLFRCQYVARQIAVKSKYQLWITPPEHDAVSRVLSTCPAQPLPTASRA